MSLTGLEKHYQDQTKVITELLDYRDAAVTRPEKCPPPRASCQPPYLA